MTSDRYQRLRATAIFRDDAFARWQAACVGIIGCGTVGSRIALETVRSGARVRLWDPDHVEEHNLGTQPLRRNLGKVASLMQSCDEINPGAATGAAVDIRHVGIAELRLCHILIDATDDPRLAWVLTEISNGLQIPLLRCALDGSGRYQLGRVLCSHAAHGGACQWCTYSVTICSALDPTPCPGQGTRRAPTLPAACWPTCCPVRPYPAQRIITGNGTRVDQGGHDRLSAHEIRHALVSGRRARAGTWRGIEPTRRPTRWRRRGLMHWNTGRHVEP